MIDWEGHAYAVLPCWNLLEKRHKLIIQRRTLACIAKFALLDLLSGVPLPLPVALPGCIAYV